MSSKFIRKIINDKIGKLFLLCLIFGLSRFLFLLFTPYSYYCEEAKIGSIGHDLLFAGGLKIPFWGYLDSPHAGGSLFSGLYVIPFYLIFGDKYLALKIAALTFSLFTLILWFNLLNHEFKDSRFFLPFLFLFTFSPPHYLQKSVILQGNVVELIFFNTLIIYFFWKYKRIPSFKNWLILGLICGFATWIQLMNFYLFICILLLTIFQKIYGKKIKLISGLFIGLLIGMLPLWIYNFLYDWAILTADARSISFNWGIKKLTALLLVDIPASFHFFDIGFIKSEHFSYLAYSVIAIASLIPIISYRKRRNFDLALFLILYLVIFILVTAFSTAPVRSDNAYGWNSMNIHAEYYLIALQPIMFILLLLIMKYSYRLATFLLFTFISISLINFLYLFETSYIIFNEKLFEPMHSTSANVYECGFNFVKNSKLFMEFKSKLPEELLEAYLKGANDAQRILNLKFKLQ